MHWYLAIICHPEYILREPPPKPIQTASHMTRKRKREEEGVSASAEDAPLSPSAAHRRSASETEEGDVEALLGGCCISQEARDIRSTPSSPRATVGSELDDGEPQLQYPMSDPMDVDPRTPPRPTSALPADISIDMASDAGMSRELSPMSTLSVPASDADEVEMNIDNDIAIPSNAETERSSSTVTASVFYGIGSATGPSPKGKAKSESLPPDNSGSAPGPAMPEQDVDIDTMDSQELDPENLESTAERSGFTCVCL